jgi:hypothetical protein
MDEKEVADAVAVELLQKYPGLAEMVQRGLIRLPLKPNGPGAYPRLESVTPPGTAARLLDEECEDRWWIPLPGNPLQAIQSPGDA